MEASKGSLDPACYLWSLRMGPCKQSAKASVSTQSVESWAPSPTFRTEKRTAGPGPGIGMFRS